MDDGLKQRLVGAIVLVAIGVIFIPSLLDKDGRRTVDLTTQVPPEPVIMPRPLEVADPVPPENIPPIKTLEENYSQIVEEDIDVAEEPADPTVVTEIDEEAVDFNANAEELISGLNAEGIPQAWSIQISSFQSEKNATAFVQKLVEAGYPAYSRSSLANNVTVYRVFVGPKINRQTALVTKDEIDRAYKTKAILVEFKP